MRLCYVFLFAQNLKIFVGGQTVRERERATQSGRQFVGSMAGAITALDDCMTRDQLIVYCQWQDEARGGASERVGCENHRLYIFGEIDVLILI